MVTTATFKPCTVEKGIREVRPGVFRVTAYNGRNPETGVVRNVARTTTGGIKAARKLRSLLETEVADGKHGSNSGTFGELLDDWLRDGKQGRAPTTIDGYKINIDTVIRPALGNIRLDKLGVQDLDAFYRRLADQGTSAAQIVHHHRIIRAALSQGEKWGKVTRNVARFASPPKVPNRPMTVPSTERVKAIIDKAATYGTPEMATIFQMAALTGMRRGELCGLRWSDVDWAGSAIVVQRSVWQTREGIGVKPTKTDRVKRLVVGEGAVIRILLERWQEVTAKAAEAEVELSPDAYVFSMDVDGVAPIKPARLTSSFKTLCREVAEEDKSGEPWPDYRLHDLRHYTGTELDKAGYSPRQIADYLGHSDPSLTMRVYVHGSDDQMVSAAKSLEAGISG